MSNEIGDMSSIPQPVSSSSATANSAISLEGERLEAWTATPRNAAALSMLGSFHVDLDNGAVWLGERRVLVMQSEWFLELRRTLLSTIGQEGTRTVLTRIGYAAGMRDAHLSMKLHPEFEISELLATGGAFHAFQGSAKAVRRRIDLDLVSKRCYLEFAWRNSIEDQGWDRATIHHRSGSCWMEIGYASGFLSTCIGAEVVVREVQCASEGAAECVCVARFAHEWDNVEEDLRYLDPATPATAVRREQSFVVAASVPTEPTHPDAPRPLIGRSGAFDATLRQVKRVAKTTATVLLLGESGVGKSALARFIHDSSDRAGKPFVEVNCAAIPEALLESELFGVQRGAFTGAINSRSGRFEEAHGGTLFLDEVGLLSAAAQGKLLRVLQSQKYERLGSNKTQQADVRLVAATNHDLAAAVRFGEFRSDLFYRLNVFPVTVPPLRSRLGDLPLLIDHLVTGFCKRYGRELTGITPQAHRAMLHHDWPGNIRELENVIERAVILVGDDEAIDLHHLFTSDAKFRHTGLHWLDEKGKIVVTGADSAMKDALASVGQAAQTPWVRAAIEQPEHSLESIERAVVLATLRTYDGNLAKAAQHLDLTRAQIDYRVKKWGVDPRMLAARGSRGDTGHAPDASGRATRA
jgi:two-component system response regulator HydG